MRFLWCFVVVVVVYVDSIEFGRPFFCVLSICIRRLAVLNSFHWDKINSLSSDIIMYCGICVELNVVEKQPWLRVSVQSANHCPWNWFSTLYVCALCVFSNVLVLLVCRQQQEHVIRHKQIYYFVRLFVFNL